MTVAGGGQGGRVGEPADAGLDLAPFLDARHRVDRGDERAVLAGGLVAQRKHAATTRERGEREEGEEDGLT